MFIYIVIFSELSPGRKEALSLKVNTLSDESFKQLVQLFSHIKLAGTIKELAKAPDYANAFYRKVFSRYLRDCDHTFMSLMKCTPRVPISEQPRHINTLMFISAIVIDSIERKCGVMEAALSIAKHVGL